MAYGWTFPKLLKSQSTVSVVALVFDGAYVWSISSAGIAVKHDYWGENTDYEALTINYQLDRNISSMYTVDTFTVRSQSGTIDDAAYWDNHIYTLEKVGTIAYINKVNYTTGVIVDTFTAPEPVQSRLCVANNKCWVVSSGLDGSDRQKLYYISTSGGSWGSTAIPGKKQTAVRDIVDGLNNNIIVTAYNEHSIIRFNSYTGAWIDTIRVNRHPYRLHTNQRRSVYIVSDSQASPLAGMVSRLTQPAGVLSNFAAAGGSMAKLWDDNFVDDDTSGNLWYMGANVKIGRLKKSDKDFRYADGGAVGYKITFDDFSPAVSSTFTYSLLTPPITYQRWNGSSFDTINVKPYLFFHGSDGYLYGARLTSMVRVNTISVLGTAMISSDQQDYYGD